MKSPKLFFILALGGVIAFAACEPKNDNPPPASYNGFQINSTTYTVDSVTERSQRQGGELRLWTSSGGGGVLSIVADSGAWPVLDGSYLYGFTPARPRLRNTVSICFQPGAGSSEKAFCVSEAITGELTPGLEIRLSAGKRQFALDGRPDRYDSVSGMLTIRYAEK